MSASEATHSSGNGRAIGAVAAGLLSAATMPVAILATRYSGSYELLHAGLAIPVGIYVTDQRNDLRLIHAGFAVPLAFVLGFAAIRLARRARRRSSRSR